MKLKFWLYGFFISLLSTNAWAADAGLRYINTRGTVRCGTDLSSNTYAYKDEGGFWRGIDADICRVFSMAIFGRSDRFQMVHIYPLEVSKALETNKIDIMLGNPSQTATSELTSKATPIDVIYYDKQMFIAKDIPNATSMEDYKGEKVCTVINSEDLFNLETYNNKYNLELKPLQFTTPQKAKEAFLLNRCNILTGNEIYLKGIYNDNFREDNKITILPEIVGYKPVYASVLKDNQTLRIAGKWIINALVLSEKLDINSKNVDVYIGVNDTSVKNLLGINPKLWEKFGLKSDWVKKELAELGNYGEIYERNLGEMSSLKLERGKNNLLGADSEGLIKSQPFL